MAKKYFRMENGKCVEFFPNKEPKNHGPQINMRKTWSGTTQVEFSQTTIEKDIADRNNR